MHEHKLWMNRVLVVTLWRMSCRFITRVSINAAISKHSEKIMMFAQQQKKKKNLVVELLTTHPVIDKRCYLPKIEEVDIGEILARLNIHLVKKFVKRLEKVSWFQG